jgi:hypothetical protein
VDDDASRIAWVNKVALSTLDNAVTIADDISRQSVGF